MKKGQVEWRGQHTVLVNFLVDGFLHVFMPGFDDILMGHRWSCSLFHGGIMVTMLVPCKV